LVTKPADTRISVRLTPRSRRNAIDGWLPGSGGRPVLKVRVMAPPVDGKANAALTALLAEALGLGKSRIRIAGGETARDKLVDIEGEAGDIAARLAALGDVA
jgi:uncharacterized protein (TIGR00251 family)